MSQNGSKAVLGFKGIKSLKSRVMGCGREGKLEQTEHHSGCISVVLGFSIPVSGDETLLLFCEVLLGNTTPKLKSFQRPLARPVIFFFFFWLLCGPCGMVVPLCCLQWKYGVLTTRQPRKPQTMISYALEELKIRLQFLDSKRFSRYFCLIWVVIF